MTDFSAIYNRFLGKITDDMYLELTPEDTLRDLQTLLIDAIPGFEFPRNNLYDYEVKTSVVRQDEVEDGAFVTGVVWSDIDEGEEPEPDPVTGEIPESIPNVIVDSSTFTADLTSEEINILALLMKQAWIERQVASIEVTRMKYTGIDWKMTSQANHLSKLLSLLAEAQRESFHMQRLYKRRKFGEAGEYKSNWAILRDNAVYK